LLAVPHPFGNANEVSSRHLNNGTHMMIRTVFSLGLLILSISFASAADPKSSNPDLDLATLVRTHGFVKPAMVQDADEATVDEVLVESSISPVPMADDALPQSEGEIVYEAPIRNPQHQPQHQHHHSTAPQRRSSSGGVLSELIELERRKNAWLKRTFLGR
jgi:hypothetical protein